MDECARSFRQVGNLPHERTKMQKAHSNRYMMAVVLGTALTAMAPAANTAARPVEPGATAVADLSRYCTACWRNARFPVDAWGDCTQEVFTRMLERVPANAWQQALSADSGEHRELVRAIDAVKKRVQRRKKYSAVELDLVADRREDSQQRIAEERSAVRRAAADNLSSRQQEIVQLSMDGWSVSDIGRQLRLSPERISDEKYKAIRKLQTVLAP